MSTGALTSGCSLTRTWCVPTVLIGSRTSIRRRSSSGPPASRTAAAMSRGPTRAKRPPAPARTPPHPHVQAVELGRHGLGVLQAADLPGRPGPLDQVDLLLGAAGPGHRETARDQVVAAVAGRDVYDVTGAAETAHFLGEDELHRCTTHVALLLARRARVRKQRHLAGVLDRRRDGPLVAGAVAGHPPGADLAAV